MKKTKDVLIGFALLVLLGMNAIGLSSGDTRFASVNYFKAKHMAQRGP